MNATSFSNFKCRLRTENLQVWTVAQGKAEKTLRYRHCQLEGRRAHRRRR